MPRYLTQGVLKPEAIAGLIANPHNRADALRPLMEAAGGTLEQYYYSIEANTVYSVCTMPDDKTVSALMAAVYAKGAAVSFSVTPIHTPDEAIEVFQEAGKISYEPPSA